SAFWGELAFYFDIQKRQNVDDVTLDDFVLRVVSFSEAPKATELLAAGVERIEELHLFYELKKKRHDLPWEFSPSHMLLENRFEKWEPAKLQLRDRFPMRVYVHLASQDEGIYAIQLSLRAGSHF